MDPQKVGNDLGVRAVLVGRVIQQGDSLTIRTELVMVSDGTELWGQQYNRKFSDVLAVQDQAFVWLEKAREEHSDWLVNHTTRPLKSARRLAPAECVRFIVRAMRN